MSSPVKLSYRTVVGVFVTYKECSLDRAAIGINSVGFEYPVIHVHILTCHCSIEAYHDHLGDIIHIETSFILNQSCNV